MRNFRYVLLLCLFLYTGTSVLIGQEYIGHDVVPTNGEYTWANEEYGTVNKTTIYTLKSSCSITNKMKVTKGVVVFDLNGHTITSKTGDFNMFEVIRGATLIIRGTGNSIISGGENIWHTAAGIHVNGGILELESGTIKNFKQNMDATATGLGCAVYITETGVFNMRGGEITDCGFNLDNHYGTSDDGSKYLYGRVPHKGGAVYIHHSGYDSNGDGKNDVYGTFNFTGGTIRNCTSYRGGAVYVSAPDAEAPVYSDIPYSASPSNFSDINSEYGFHMSGSAEIDNCIASYRGGAVYVDATNGGRAYFEMLGGTIKNCKARSAGCGVHVKGRFEMTGGVIKDNVPNIDTDPSNTDYSLDYADQMLMEANAPLGGGICAEGRYEDGENKDNQQDAIPFYYPAIVNISGGTISGNVAASGGGLMAYDHSEFILANATFTNNHAIGYKGTGNGGAIYVNNAKFTFNSGTLSDNKARRYGGAININSSAEMSLNGDCIITGNQAGHGGGISQEAGECSIALSNAGVRISRNRAIGNYDEKKDATGESYIMPYEYNYLEGNGGGLFVEKGTLTMSAGQITENSANGSGGGIALRSERLSGNITLEVSGEVEIKNNIANYDRDNEGTGEGEAIGGNGGGIDIYGVPSNTEETIITANIVGGALKGNLADNGGGISVYINNTNNDKNSASISLGEGSNAALIEANTANVNGGGLYVFNNTAKRSTVVFNGGNLLKNTSKNGQGGGICVEGIVNLTTTGTNVKNNTAKNGGGIYLSGGAAMTFNGGLICNNVAEGTPVSGSTAFQDDADNAGVGGGVYLASGTSLKFFKGVVKNAFGLYGNTASTAADDIFARGSNTNLQLPKVSGMALDGFDVPTSELYWVEDYVEKDANYTQGTKVNNSYADGSTDILRYRYALRNFKDINKIVFEDDKTSKTYESYVCLALGYEQYFVNLVKEGLEKDDSAIFNVLYKNKEGDYEQYRTLLFHRDKSDESGKATASVVLTAGDWKFVEDANWSGKKYKLSSVSSNLPLNLDGVAYEGLTYTDSEFNFNIGSKVYEQLRYEGKTTFDFIITNTSAGNILPPSAESAVINRIPTVVTQ